MQHIVELTQRWADSRMVFASKSFPATAIQRVMVEEGLTLVAFLVVSIAVIILRQRQPELPRSFRVPGYPVVPILSVLGCLWIIKDLRLITIDGFLVWVAVALIWYFSYSVRHSHLGRPEPVGLTSDVKED